MYFNEETTWGQPPSAVRRSNAPLSSLSQNPVEPMLDRTAEGGCPHARRGTAGFEKKNGWVGSRCAEQSDLEGRQTRPIPA
jgi:hypothetical protein